MLTYKLSNTLDTRQSIGKVPTRRYFFGNCLKHRLKLRFFSCCLIITSKLDSGVQFARGRHLTGENGNILVVWAATNSMASTQTFLLTLALAAFTLGFFFFLPWLQVRLQEQEKQLIRGSKDELGNRQPVIVLFISLLLVCCFKISTWAPV